MKNHFFRFCKIVPLRRRRVVNQSYSGIQLKIKSINTSQQNQTVLFYTVHT